MNKSEVIAKVKALKLPQNSYVVFGAAPLAIYGIRDANDIDLMASENALNQLKQAGWQQITKGPLDQPYQHDDIEAHPNWDFSPYSPTLQQLLQTATVIDDVPFASLNEIHKWKLASGRSKDVADLKLIDEYISRKASANS